MRLRRVEPLLLALWLGSAWPAQAQPAALAAPAASTQAPALTRDGVDAAAAALRQDPDLKGTRSERTLRWKDSEEPPPPPSTTPSWVLWLRDLFEWFNDAGRALIWGLGALLLALLLLQLRLFWQRHQGAALPQVLELPTHVNQLDIRPQALPDDVGAAALALWQQGHALEAMSLLYRGALSRLVHTHAVPIRSSSTEGDCLRLAQPRLGGAAQDYFAALVGVWCSTVYAARPPDAALAQTLCAEFETRLPRRTP